jgi:ABC-type nickel/cobalt efflux system permease component RcnA
MTSGQSRWRPFYLALITTLTHAFSILAIALIVHGLLFSAGGLSQEAIASGLSRLSAVIMILLAAHTVFEYFKFHRNRRESPESHVADCDCPTHRLKAKVLERVEASSNAKLGKASKLQLAGFSQASTANTRLANIGLELTRQNYISQSASRSTSSPKFSKSMFRTLIVGIAVGLIPCPSALAALSTALVAGDYLTIVSVISMFSIGIFITLCSLGLFALRILNQMDLGSRSSWRMHYAYLIRFVAFAGTGVWHLFQTHVH